MEKLHSYELGECYLFLLLLFCLLPFQLPSSAYTPLAKYFINCGSKSDIDISNRIFVGDMNSGDVSFTKQGSSVMEINQLSSTPSVYQTARIFRQPSSYEFEIDNNGTYLVRLHFSYSSDLSAAVFDVWASGFFLLHKFTIKNSSDTPQIKEFLLHIPTGKFSIYFTPQQSSSAFVNALEVFLAPEGFISDEARQISPAGNGGPYKGIRSHALETTHRINVGGSKIAPEEDTLWRTWVSDEAYLVTPNTAKNSSVYLGKLNDLRELTEFVAPTRVYQTAKEINISTGHSSILNVTWSYAVAKNTRHLIRFHFCDIISQSLDVLQFNFYISDKFGEVIDPFTEIPQLAAPFYRDYVFNSDDSGVLNITIGNLNDSLTQNGFLNGVEILEMMEKSGSAPLIRKQSRRQVFVIVGSVIGGLVLSCALASVLFAFVKRRKLKPYKTPDSSLVNVVGEGSVQSIVTEGMAFLVSPVPHLNLGLRIPFAEIQSGTKNFDKKLLIGKGGFGNVYRGTLINGQKVAVKRSKPGSGQGMLEFQREITVLSKIRHRHLVSLIGYCDERSEMILVYEFMEKGTLRDHLYDSNLPCLSWKQRLEVCIGAARGLHYLHTGLAGGIIHRDVKSTNILLDENHVAKVADFGLSKSGPSNESYVSTNVKGTFGYLDPEYFRTQQLTEKSDVYSFGVVLLEVLFARPAIDPQLPREEVNLAEWGMMCKKKGLLESIVDPSIKSQINPSSLRKFAETAEKCLQDDSTDRPSMGDVLWDLEYVLQLQQTVVHREPHEDSTTDASSTLPFQNVQRFPSLNLDEKQGMPFLSEDSSLTSASKVFSQLKMEDAR